MPGNSPSPGSSLARSSGSMRPGSAGTWKRGGSREAVLRPTFGLATLVRVRYPMGVGQPERRGTGMATKKVEEGRLNVRLSKDFLKRLKVECVRRELTLQAAAEEALDAWLRAGRGAK